MEKKNLFDISLSLGEYREFIKSITAAAKENESAYTCVANVHMLIEAHNDKSFANIVSNANVITPDGKPLTWALKILYHIRQERVAGMDLLPDLLESAVDNNIPVYFYGGTEELLGETKEFLHLKYPYLHVAGMYSPPFRKLFNEEEEEIINNINNSGAGLVFVILGCPKQECWMSTMKGHVKAVMIGVGGALPVMIGKKKRAPVWMQKAGMEWFYRLAQEPKRLFKRYAVTNSQFLFMLLKEFVRLRILKFAR